MKIYTEGGEPLHEILKAASSDQGATLLVPDLQRPYVWTPSQVTLLVDSLLRGWPFGTLLLWSVHKEELAGIPSRPFWRVVDRTGEFDDQQVGKSNPPAQFRMVLDGQQRLQSLLLAFGGDAWGFRLLDQEWSRVLDAERPKGKNAWRHWSLGHLCLDVWAFRERLKNAGDIDSIDFRDVLSWVVQNPNEGRSAWPRPANYKFPITSAFDAENKGRFVRVSRLWDLAPTQQKPAEKVFRAKLEPLLNDHDVPKDVVADVLDSLAELMSKIVDIKQATVSFLQLSPCRAAGGLLEPGTRVQDEHPDRGWVDQGSRRGCDARGPVRQGRRRRSLGRRSTHGRDEVRTQGVLGRHTEARRRVAHETEPPVPFRAPVPR